MKVCLGRLINAPAEDIILANSASYGLHLLANGIKWSSGDKVLLVEGDFACNILAWLNLKKMGIKIRRIKPKSGGLRPEEIQGSMGTARNYISDFLVHC